MGTFVTVTAKQTYPVKPTLLRGSPWNKAQNPKGVISKAILQSWALNLFTLVMRKEGIRLQHGRGELQRKGDDEALGSVMSGVANVMINPFILTSSFHII